MRRTSICWALLLIAGGVVLLLANLGILSIHIWAQWPLIPLIMGLGMLGSAFMERKTAWGLFIPGSVLLVTGGLLYACANFSWSLMATWWPLFIAAPGLGFLLAFLFGERSVGLLIPACILLALAGTFLLAFGWQLYQYWLPISLLVAGVILLVSAFLRKKPAA